MWDQYKWSYTVSQLILGPGGLLIEISDRVNHLFVTLSNYEFFKYEPELTDGDRKNKYQLLRIFVPNSKKAAKHFSCDQFK